MCSQSQPEAPKRGVEYRPDYGRTRAGTEVVCVGNASNYEFRGIGRVSDAPVAGSSQLSRTEDLMLKRFSFITAVAALLLAGGYAGHSQNKLSIPVERLNPTDGKLMYSNYCAPCHGMDGRGSGPVAGALKTRPTDLTMLARTNGGKYPDDHVTAVLEFGTAYPAHGTAEMPVWGPLLAKISNVHTQERALRLANLTHYLESIQAK